MKTLTDLTDATGMEVFDHLVRDAEIPVLGRLQAQGDIFAVPDYTDLGISVRPGAVWSDVPPQGVEVVRGQDGRNPHVLVADPGTCRWTTDVDDPADLAIGVLEATAPVHLLHPEHGGSGIAPGRYAIRRQREQREEIMRVAD